MPEHLSDPRPLDLHGELRRLETQHDRLCAWLRAELGYDTESEGNVHRRLQETHEVAAETLQLLRGEGSNMGLIGRVEILSKSWNVLLCSVTAFVGYLARLLTE